MSVLKKLAGQTAVYGLSSIVGRMFNYLLTPILTNYFTTGQFGINTEFFAYISFLNVIFTFGMETAYFRFAKQHPEQQVFQSSNSSLLFSSIIFSGLLLLLSPFINKFLHYQQQPYFIWMMVGILFFDTICTIPFARLRIQNRPMKYASMMLTKIAVNAVIVLFFVVAAPWLIQHNFNWVEKIYSPALGIGYVFVAALVASAFTCLLFLPDILKNIAIPDKKLLREILPYALPLVLVGLAGMVNETFDRILLNYLVPDVADAKSQIGIYGACYKIAIIITLFIQAFRMGAEPFFFNQSTQENAKQVYANVMQLFVAACLLIVFGTLLFIDYIQYFVGKDFRVGLQVVPILLLANLCLGVYYNLSVWYKLTNKTIIGGYITLLGAVITLALNFWLIPTIGYVGSAWATLACYSVMMVVSYFVGQRFYTIPYSLKNMGLQLLVVLAAFAVTQLLVSNVYLHFGIVESRSVVGFIALLLIFSGTAFLIFNMNKKVLKAKL